MAKTLSFNSLSLTKKLSDLAKNAGLPGIQPKWQETLFNQQLTIALVTKKTNLRLKLPGL